MRSGPEATEITALCRYEWKGKRGTRSLGWGCALSTLLRGAGKKDKSAFHSIVAI